MESSTMDSGISFPTWAATAQVLQSGLKRVTIDIPEHYSLRCQRHEINQALEPQH
jgi:hypothetical protein